MVRLVWFWPVTVLLAINHYKTTKSLNGISLIQYTSIIISFYCSLISQDDFQTRIVRKFSSCYYNRSVYPSAPTSHIFISQVSVQQIQVDSAFVSGQSVLFMELHRYIIMRSHIVIVTSLHYHEITYSNSYITTLS